MVQTMNFVRISGNGACEALFNGEIQREIARQNEAHRKEISDMKRKKDFLEASRNRMLSEKLTALKESKRPSLVERVRERVETAWSIVWAWMLAAGLVKEE